MDKIYLDNAATTTMRKEAVEAMQPYLSEDYGNPSSIHAMSRAPRGAVRDAREIIARTLNAEPDEIYFTSGGTESDNWALCSSVMLNPKGKKHVIVSAIEHHAILETADFLEKMGYGITRVGVDNEGIVKLDELEKAIRASSSPMTTRCSSPVTWSMTRIPWRMNMRGMSAKASNPHFR